MVVRGTTLTFAGQGDACVPKLGTMVNNVWLYGEGLVICIFQRSVITPLFGTCGPRCVDVQSGAPDVDVGSQVPGQRLVRGPRDLLRQRVDAWDGADVRQ